MRNGQRLIACLLTVAAAVHGAQAANSLLNSSYIGVKFDQSHTAINSHSNGTFSWIAAQDYLPDGYLKSGFFAMAKWDANHKTTHYKQAVQAGNTHYAQHPGACHSHWNVDFVNFFNDFPSWCALAALEEDAAYGGTNGLDQAKQVFQFISDHGVIKQSDIDAGYLVDTKLSNNTLHASCNGQSMLNGVYWENGCAASPDAQNNPNVNAVSTGLYALVGASLCRLTGNMTYCDRAYASLQWMDRVLKTSEGLIYDHIAAPSCELTKWLFAYNSAVYFAAYADLGDLTNNATALSLARQTALASMTTSKWNDARGIITQAVSSDLTSPDFDLTFGPILLRYLDRSYGYFGADMQEAILDYVNIQYWAITQLDADSNTHPTLYGRNWTGPAFEVATNLTVVAALDVLNGIDRNPVSVFPTTTGTTQPVATQTST